MKLIKHKTPEEIIAAYWHFEENGMTLEDFLQSEGGATTGDGEEVSFTGADELAGIKDNGFGDFATPKPKPSTSGLAKTPTRKKSSFS